LRIAVDAHLYPRGSTYRSAGVSRYVRELVLRLPTVAPEHEFVFYVPPQIDIPFGSPSRLPTHTPLVRIAWEQIAEPVENWRRRVELIHSPVNVSSLLLSAPSVVTIHDLSFVRFPDRVVPAKRWYQRTMSAHSARHARRVIVPSRATKEDCVAAFGIDPDRVTVIPEGVGSEFHVDPSSRPPLDQPYILHVGTLEPRKNLPRLIAAFAQFKADGRPHSLALVGPKGWMYEQIEAAIESAGLEDSVRLVNFVPDLAPWYNHADFFVYPSLYEGFGLPPLEAMACGTPVVLSSAGSLSEVAGDAALLVSPSDTGGLVTAMRTMADNATLRDRFRIAGLARAAQFSWDETARRTVEVYEAASRDG